MSISLSTKYWWLHTFFFCFLFVFVNTLNGAEITAVSGSLKQGEPLTIDGSSFGLKPDALPIKSDDFEWGNVGDFVEIGTATPTWTAVGSDSGRIDDSQHHSGTQSAHKALRADNANCTYCSSYISFPASQELYMSYWVRYEKSTTAVLPGSRPNYIKFNRMNSGGTHYSGIPSLSLTLFAQHDIPETGRIELQNAWGTRESDKNLGRSNDHDMHQGEWHRVEMYMKLSDPEGMNNGELQWFLNGRKVNTSWNISSPTSVVTRGSETNNLIDSVSMLFEACGYNQDNYPLLWQDDIYVDNTRARVEIGDASTWDACSHREIQLATTWNNEQIEIIVNLGNMDPQSDKYLFVIDKEGNVSTTGYSLADINSSIAPSIPQILTIEHN